MLEHNDPAKYGDIQQCKSDTKDKVSWRWSMLGEQLVEILATASARPTVYCDRRSPPDWDEAKYINGG